MATKYPTTGPKPVDNGRLGGNPSGFTPSGGLGGAVSPWATPGASGNVAGGVDRPGSGISFGGGPATASQIGLGTSGGLQSLFGGGGVSAPAPAPAGNWMGARPGGGLDGPMGTPGLGSISGGGLGGGLQTRPGATGSAPYHPPLIDDIGGGSLGGAPTWQQANGGTQQGMGYGLAPAPAPRTGIQFGNRGAQKRMGRTQLGAAPSESGLGEAPGGSSAPATAPSMPGITGDPGPAGGGLQSLLARARQISPWAKGF